MIEVVEQVYKSVDSLTEAVKLQQQTIMELKAEINVFTHDSNFEESRDSYLKLAKEKAATMFVGDSHEVKNYRTAFVEGYLKALKV